MGPALGPVDAGPAKNTTLGSRDRQIDPETPQKGRADFRHLAGLGAKYDEIARRQAVRDANAKLAGEVVVAGTCVTDLRVRFGARLETRRSGQRHGHDALEHLADVRPGQPVVAVAAL